MSIDGLKDKGHHSNLTGLGNDDHPQYLNEARGDARYPLIAAALLRAGGVMTGRLTTKAVRETVVDLGTIANGGTATVDLSLGTIFRASQTGGTGFTVAISNGAEGDSFYLRVYTSVAIPITWPAGIYWKDGEAVSPDALGFHVYSFVYDGAWFASYVGNYAIPA